MIYDTKELSMTLSFLRLCHQRLIQKKTKKQKKVTRRRERSPALKWADFLAKPFLARDREKRMYQLFRMSEDKLDALAASLNEYKKKHERHSKHGKRMGAPEVVETHVALAMVLRYLAGGAYCDICLIFNVVPSTFRTVFKRTVEQLYEILPEWELTAALDEAETKDNAPKL
jgi:hypothetical protein